MVKTLIESVPTNARQCHISIVTHVYFSFLETVPFLLKSRCFALPFLTYCLMSFQAPIAAVLLMHMPAEQAFWCLVSICEKYLPGYYSAGLVGPLP